MRSLFVKVFLWFWLATTLSGVALFLIGLATHTGPRAEHRRRLTEQWRHMGGQTLALYGEAAAVLLKREGQAALEDYTQRVERATGIRVILFLHGHEIVLGREASADARRLAERAMESGRTEIDEVGERPVLATRILGSQGEVYVVTGIVTSPHPPGVGPPPPMSGPQTGLLAEFPRFLRGFSMPALVSFFVGGLVCLGLAWHLTAPVRRLRATVQRFAGGELTARVGAGRGGDEIAALGRDFDVMAERIEGLMTAQRQLLRDISHELRSPLTRLNVALDLVRQRSGPEVKGMLGRIEREAVRLNDLIGQLLTLTKISTGGDLMPREPVSLTYLVQEIAADADFEAHIQHRSVRVVTEDELIIQGVEEILRRGIENVVRNAVRYTAEQTQVDITVSRRSGRSGDEVVIRVRDHGPGVPQSALSQLFLPFYRVADARDRQSGGTGIGLAITERAVHLHNGTVTAANAQDGGLIVDIVLPIATP
ncbi:MAG: HAMP domain-containing protein [Candidatus Methylomirabilis oxygeniifera]|uniref:histidine kinase n=1 Tax=Methylomirabilis oxygeniifera TaxID=671143 RepID=D5MN99_METO1|nr:MAG: HAMP domain-containing protein [Candidatus Methylomirabilis oxyfera]CBE70243.1 Periplasmic sensor signal transduction histidine kinase precursor [Candidatus Methylomirabilis oxyfera]